MSFKIQHSPSRAVAYMSAGTAFIACTDILMKHLAAEHSLPAILWVRNLMIVPAVYLLLRRSGEWAHTRARQSRLHLLRGVLMGVSPIMYFIALMAMPVAELTAINLTMPVIMALMAVALLGEPLNPRRIAAVLLGFAGVLAIIRPGTDAFSPYTLLALGAATGGAAFQILTRKLAGTQSAMASLFYPWVIGTVLCTPFAFYRWTPPATAVDWLLVAVIAVFSLTGNTLMVRSYQYAPASLIAPFIYTQLIWAAALGLAVFGDFPDGWSLAGMVTIVVGGMLLVQRRSLLRR